MGMMTVKIPKELLYLFGHDNSGQLSRGIIRLNPKEAELLFEYASKSVDTIVELGTFNGGSAILMASANESEWVVSVDINPNPIAKSNVDASGLKNLRLLSGNSRSVEWHGPVGLLFVDADHKPKSVEQDIATWSPFVVGGGYCALHDIKNVGTGLEYIPEWSKQFGWTEIDCAESMVIMQKEGDSPIAKDGT